MNLTVIPAEAGIGEAVCRTSLNTLGQQKYSTRTYSALWLDLQGALKVNCLWYARLHEYDAFSMWSDQTCILGRHG